MSAQAMKDSSATQNMMYLWVSDYIFETISYVAQKHNFLVYNLTAKDVSRSFIVRLGKNKLCLGWR